VNTNPEHIIDDLLVSYLLGEATPAQRKEVEDWLAASAENKKYFENFKSILEESRTLSSQRNVNENDAWERLVKRAQEDELSEQQNTPKGRTISFFGATWMRVAAMLVVLAGVGSLLFTMNNGSSEMIAQSGDTPITDTLPDGSVVTLNKNSTLTYPAKFDGDKRTVKLTGEAFFNITPNKSKPFVIDADATSVTVVGTSFNVKTSPERTEVIVETGIVQVAKKEKSVRLLPHQKATVVAGKEEPQMETNTDELYGYYRSGEFVCKATPLSKLTDILNEAYGSHIVIKDPKLRETPITTAFKNESLDGILKVISETLSLTVERKGDSIFLHPGLQ
jgi:transmembrane sensor